MVTIIDKEIKMLMWFFGYFLVLPVLCLDIKNSSIDLENFSTTTTPESIHFMSLDTAVICKFQPNGYDCDGAGWLRSKFYYDIKLEDCKTFTARGCAFNLNSFASLSECHNTCRDVGTQPLPAKLSPRIFCRLQYDFGYCNDYYPRWYFDVTSRRCRGFSYSGCGGNLNRFSTQRSCTAACSGVTEYKTELD